MKLFQIIQMLDDEIKPEDCKIHLAARSGKGENPLDVYLAGDFDRWQESQTQKNFQKKYVVSLISLPEKNGWLFAGVHDSLGCKPKAKNSTCFRYSLRRREATNELCGRLVVRFDRTFRQSYLVAQRWVDDLIVAEMRTERYQVIEFPGFSQAMVTKQELDLIVGQQISSWRSALSSVAGVYVIADTKTGKFYIGSATGDHGIWGRWCQYSKSGHGGNKELRALLKKKGAKYATNFQYGILETADSRASENDVIVREVHWKELLLSRLHGYNSN